MNEQISFVDHLDEDIKESIIEYTSQSYYILNKRLRNNEKLDDHYLHILSALDEAFENVPPLTESITVFRGLNTNEFILNTKAYVSASLNEERALHFVGIDCCLMRILLPAGTKLLPLFKISQIPHEEEILLPRDSKFKISLTSEIQLVGNIRTTTIYDILHIPNISITITPQTKTNNIQNALEDIEWVSRLVNIAKLDMEEFDISAEEALQDTINHYYNTLNIPQNIINKALQELNKF